MTTYTIYSRGSGGPDDEPPAIQQIGCAQGNVEPLMRALRRALPEHTVWKQVEPALVTSGSLTLGDLRAQTAGLSDDTVVRVDVGFPPDEPQWVAGRNAHLVYNVDAELIPDTVLLEL